MRIFVTGGSGFIGRYVVRELDNQEHQLLLLSRQPKSVLPSLEILTADMVAGDLSDIDKWKSKVKHFRPEAAIHLAWEDLPNYDIQTSLRNLNQGLSLITMLAESGCQSVICAGSCWEYGQTSGKLSEETAVKPYNAFTAAKNALHWLGREIAKEKGMHFIWTRLFYVYGPGQRETSLIPYIIDCARKGERPEIKAPLNRNDFVYVGDVARAVAVLVKKPETDGVYNIGSGSSTSVQEIAEIVCDKFNFPGKYDTLSNLANSRVVDSWADISRMKNDFGWEPRIGIKEGIQKVIDGYVGENNE